MVFIGEMIVSLLKIWYGNSTVIWLKSDRKAIAGLYAFYSIWSGCLWYKEEKGQWKSNENF